MKNQFTNTVEKLETDSLRAVNVVNNDTGAEIVCNATGAELIAKHGSIKAFFNGLFEKGIKAIKITDKLKNGSSYRKYGDEYVFEFAPKVEQVQTQSIAPVVQTQPLNGLNAGMNGTIYRDMDYPRIAAELESSKSEVKRLTEENRKLETKILINDTLEGKSIAKSEANAKLMESATPILAALAEKILAQNPVAQPGLNAANLSQIKQHGIKILSGMHDDLVDNINLIMLKSNDNQIQQGIIDLADIAEKL